MRKNMSVAIAAGLVLALGVASNASADGYEYYVPKPEPKNHVYEHHGYEQNIYQHQTVYVEQSRELNGQLNFSGWSGGVGNTAGASGGGGGGFVVLGGNRGFGFGGAGAFVGAAAFASASASASVSFSGGGGGHGGGHGGGGH